MLVANPTCMILNLIGAEFDYEEISKMIGSEKSLTL
jgi:hypothetical protein